MSDDPVGGDAAGCPEGRGEAGEEALPRSGAAPPARAPGADAGSGAGQPDAVVLERLALTTVRPVAGCDAHVEGGVSAQAGLSHLRPAHLLTAGPAEVVAALQLEAFGWCEHAWVAARRRKFSSPLAAHQPQCRLNPRQVRHRPGLAPAAGGRAAAGGAAEGPSSAAAAAPLLFHADTSAWSRRLDDFLADIAPGRTDWAPLVPCGARSAAHVPAALVGPKRQLI